MSSRKAYTIAFEGLKAGLHTFSYHLDDDFFERHPYGLIDKGNVEVTVTLDKKNAMLDLTFFIEGTVIKPCDRCLREIEIDIDGEYEHVFRLGEGEDEAELTFIPSGSNELDIEHYLYEFTSLSVPMNVTCAEYTDEKCPEKVNDIIIDEKDDVEQTGDKKTNPFKEALKDLNLEED